MIVFNVKFNKFSTVVIPLLPLFFRGFKYLLNRGVFRAIAVISIAFADNTSVYATKCTGRSVANNIL